MVLSPMFITRAVAAVAAASLACLSLPALTPSAQAATHAGFTVSGPRSVEQGDKVTYTAKPGTRHKFQLAVLEETTSKGRIPLSVARVGKDGTATFKTTLPVSGHHNLDVRVLKGRATVSESQALHVSVTERAMTAAQKKEAAAEAAQGAAMAKLGLGKLGVHTSKPGTTPGKGTGRNPGKRQGVDPAPAGNGDYANLDESFISIESEPDWNGEPILPGLLEGPVAPVGAPAPAARPGASSMANGSVANRLSNVSSAASKAESTFEKTERMTVGTFAKGFGEFLGVESGAYFLSMGLDALLGAIFPDNEPTTEDLLDNLTNQMQEDFALAQVQLADIESGLSTLQQQVSTVSSQITSTNASASAANCTAVMSQANGYVNQLQGTYNNYQDVLNPTWLNANLTPGANPDADMRVIGNEVFGTGAGTPSFLQGLNSTQQASINLANLLTGINLPPGNSLIDVCSSAVSAALAASSSTFNSGYVTPVGIVDQDYFDIMQAITAYYAGWSNAGQFLATAGSQWAILTLDPTPPVTAASASTPCTGVGPASQGSTITCAGLAYNIEAQNSAVSYAWDRTGASWAQATNGVLAADTRLSATANYMVPSANVWVRDPYALNGTNGTAVQAGTFTSAGIQVNGLALRPALSAQWNNLLQISSQKPYPGSITGSTTACGSQTAGAPNSVVNACTGSVSMGQLISAAGLSFNQAPVSSFVFTTETSDWNIADSAMPYWLTSNYNVGDPIANSGTAKQYVDQHIQSYANQNLPINSFIDPALVGNSGFSAVVHDPAGGFNTLTLSDLYPWANGTTLAMNYADTASYVTPYLACQTNYQGASNTWVDTPPGASRLWPQWLNEPAGSAWTVQTATNACGQAGQAGKLQASADPSMYGTGLQLQTSGYQASDCNTAAYGVQPCATGGPSNVSVSVPTTSQIFNAFNTSTVTEKGIVWPAFSLSSPTCLPSGSLSGWTNFSQGLNNNAGVTNLCEYLWGGYKAAMLGQPTGNLSLVAPDQKTGQSTGQSATIAVYNGASSATTATLYLSGAEGVSLPGTVTATNGSSAQVTSCQPGSLEGVADTQCTVIVQPGAASLSIPLTYQSGDNSGDLLVMLSDYSNTAGVPTSYAAATVVVLSSPVSAGALPPSPDNLAISPSANSADEIVATWTAPSVNPAITSYTMEITDPNGNQTSDNIPLNQLTTVGNSDGQTGTDLIIGGSQTIVGAGAPTSYSYSGSGQSATTGCTLGCAPWTATVDASSGAVTFSSANQGNNSIMTVNVNGTQVYSSNVISTGATWTSTPVALSTLGGAGTYPVTVSSSSGQATPGTLTVTATASATLGNATVTNSDMQVSTTIALPNTDEGSWTFSLTAQNSNGTSDPVTVSTFLGQGPPSAIQNLQATENANGSITVTWTPLQATPAVSGYTIAWQEPDGQWYDPQTVIVPQFTLPSVANQATAKPLTLGTWNFQVRATNPQGNGPVAKAQVNVQGSAPSAPANLHASVSPDGWVSATWSGGLAVPAPTSYNVGVYNSANTLVASEVVDVSGDPLVEVNLPNFMQLTSTSVPGTYYLAVQGVNSIGAGASGMTAFVITKGLISQITNTTQMISNVTGMPSQLAALLQAQCQAGWKVTSTSLGTCNATTSTWTPAAGTTTTP